VDGQREGKRPEVRGGIPHYIENTLVCTAHREVVSGLKGPSFDPADSRVSVGCPAAHYFGDRYAAGDREIGTASPPGIAEFQHGTSLYEDRAPSGQPHIGDFGREVGAANRDQRVVPELDRRASKRHLEPGRAAIVADERVGEAQSHRIHRTARRDTVFLVAEPTEILNGRQEP